MLFRSKMSLSAIQNRKPYVYFGFVILASIITSLCNTMALYVDSKMFGYYEYHMVFGVLFVRLGTGIVSAVVMAVIAIPVLRALKASKLVAVS